MFRQTPSDCQPGHGNFDNWDRHWSQTKVPRPGRAKASQGCLVRPLATVANLAVKMRCHLVWSFVANPLPIPKREMQLPPGRVRASADSLTDSLFQQERLLDRAPLTGIIQPFHSHRSALGGHHDGKGKVRIRCHASTRLQIKNRLFVNFDPDQRYDIAKYSTTRIVNTKTGFHGVPDDPSGFNRIAWANTADKSQP